MKLSSRRPADTAAPILGPALGLAGLLCLLSLSACGGGETKTGSTGTGSSEPPPEILTASGPLTDLGPAAIAGVGLNDTTAQIFINTQASRPTAELRLGMTTEVNGNIPGNAAAGTATAMNVQSSAKGPVLTVDAAAGRIGLPGLVAQVDLNTILDGVPPLTVLAPGARLEIHGLPLPQAGMVLATRITALPAAVGQPVELYGTVSGLTASQLSVSGVTVSTAAVAITPPPVAVSPAPPTALANNARVRVVGTYSGTSNTITATQIITGLQPSRPDGNTHILEGIVESVSSTGRFRLNDTEVQSNAAQASIAAQIIPGSRVRVRGPKQQGILNAAEIRLIGPSEKIEYQLQGEISDFVSLSSFRVRGELVDASTASLGASGPALIANGRRVRLTAVAGPNALTVRTLSFQ